MEGGPLTYQITRSALGDNTLFATVSVTNFDASIENYKYVIGGFSLLHNSGTTSENSFLR